MTLTSSKVGTIFSIDVMTMCTGGRTCVRSPLPSLVTMTDVPVSAMRKFAPVIPTSAARNLERRIPRASFTSSRGSSRLRLGSRCVCSLRKSASTCALVRCTAGAMMWLGISPRSWMMYSPRSVSTGVMPLASRCWLRWISSATMLLPLVTVLAPAARHSRRMMSRASAAVEAQCTVAPAAVAFFS